MAKTAAVDSLYIAASTNRHAHAADVQGSLIAFGSSSLVGLWDAADALDRGVYETLPGHTGTVTCTRFVSQDALVTADDSGALLLWKREGSQWKNVVKKAGHSKPISAMTVYGDYIVTGASDASVKIWQLSSSSDPSNIDELQSIQLKGRYLPLSIALTRLPQSEALILAVGGTDRKVQVWTRSGGEFVQSLSLAGHEDWVKSLAFRPPSSHNDALVLASGSQDATIRLWNIEPHVRMQAMPSSNGADPLSDELLDAFEASLGELGDTEEGGRAISLKRHMLTVKGTSGQQVFTVTFDALLVGHEAGITNLCWRPQSSAFPEHTLLSTSTDSSVILWSPSTVLGSTQSGNTTLWINRQRFGDIGGQRLGGFVGGLWAREGHEVLAWGWSGGWRRWRCTAAEGNEDWVEAGAITGHSAPVRSLAWSPNGEYLLSASLDQTTRIHGETSVNGDPEKRSWHEISRPQVHGYDLLGVAFLDSLRFVSIADEKVARVFEAPQEFVDVVHNLHVADVKTSAEIRPRAATVPPLGLSNKAVSDPSAAASFQIGGTKRRPFEGELAAFTLWPEIEKVFGHGYESITLAVSTNKKLAATACKATSAEHAVVRVYDTDKWQPVGEPLSGHTLTVTSIAFSPDDKYILSASRDRSWYLYERKEAGGVFFPVAADKSHSRIIWDCSWAYEGDIFATASRDKTVKIWHIKSLAAGGRWTPEATLKLSDAATAVAFDAVDGDQRRRMAVGLESGQIVIFSSAVSAPSEWKEEQTIPSSIAHVGQVHRISWRAGGEGKIRQLASCSEDGTLKILGVHIGTD